MIASLKGKIIAKADNFALIEVNGIGYEVFFSSRAMKALPDTQSDFYCFCYLEANERQIRLYGFLTFEQLELFKIVRAISGVGPKAALEISAIGSLAQIKEFLEKDDTKFLEGLEGVGAKKAQKIILELSGKIKNLGALAPKEKSKDLWEKDEAYLALVQLGFAKEKVKEALSHLPPHLTNNEERIKTALQMLGH